MIGIEKNLIRWWWRVEEILKSVLRFLWHGLKKENTSVVFFGLCKIYAQLVF